MSNTSQDDSAVWNVTLVYEGGPRAGHREGRSMREDPENTTIMAFEDPIGEEGYAIVDRDIDRAARTAVLTLRHGAL